MQVPQSTVPPQLSLMDPQSAPTSAQVTFVQPHWLLVHTSGSVHVPHTMLFPQPSLMVPHFAPTSAQVFAVQPQAFCCPPPPQVSGGVQVPQSIRWPQPSLIWPHPAPEAAQVTGVQGLVPHWFGPPPPHDWPLGHVPHSSTPLQPSGTLPQLAPSAEHVAGVQPEPSDPPLSDPLLSGAASGPLSAAPAPPSFPPFRLSSDPVVHPSARPAATAAVVRRPDQCACRQMPLKDATTS